jgi:hypothetical protein
VPRLVSRGAFNLALVRQRALVDGQDALVALRQDPRPPAAEDLEAVLEPAHLGGGLAQEVHEELDLVVLEHRHVLQLFGELGGGDGVLLQSDGERLGGVAGVGQADGVLGAHPELVPPSGLQPAQGQLREGDHQGGGAHPVRRTGAPVLHEVAGDGRAAIADGLGPEDCYEVGGELAVGGEVRLAGR